MRTVVAVVFLLASACGGGEDGPPSYDHDEPDESAGETCVLCHSCATDGVVPAVAPTVDRAAHAVCEDCHATDPVTHNCDGQNCDWHKSCQDPPYANCGQCHAQGVPQTTTAQVNDACRACHRKE